MADLDDSEARSIYGWRYANTMPLTLAKRKVEVVAIKTMPYKEFLETYKNEITYNKKYSHLPAALMIDGLGRVIRYADLLESMYMQSSIN